MARPVKCAAAAIPRLRHLRQAFPRTGDRVRLELLDIVREGEKAPARGTVIRRADGAAVGGFVLEHRSAALIVHSLCIEEAERGYGLGSEAARLLREAAGAGPWKHLRAWAPPDRGLAVYFWSRMGLRPLFGKGPEGGLWFERGVG